MNMDWTQTLTIIATVVGGVFTFYKLTRDEITLIRDNMRQIDEKFTLSMQKIDEKFTLSMQKMDEHHRQDMHRMDEKWERLFERLLIKENN